MPCTRRFVLSLLIGTLVLAPAACGGTPETSEDARLLDARAEAVRSLSRTRRARMNITGHVRPLQASDSIQRIDIPLRGGDENMIGGIIDQCGVELRAATGEEGWAALCTGDTTVLLPSTVEGGPPEFSHDFLVESTEPGTRCLAVACATQLYTCVANKLIELSQNVGTMEFDVNLGPNDAGVDQQGKGVLGPQRREAQVALAEEAFYWARESVLVAGENLKRMAGKTSTDADVAACPQLGANANVNAIIPIPLGVANGEEEPETLPLGVFLVEALKDSTFLAEEAARRAAELHLDVADATYSETADIGVAAQVAWNDPYISRARAAHILTGGPDRAPLQGTEGAGFGLTAELSQGAKDALQVLRTAAPNPAMLTEMTGGRFAYTFENLFEGGAGDSPIRVRLAERMGTAAVGSMSTADYLETSGLTVADFDAARAWIREDLRAFPRSLTATLPALVTGGNYNASGGVDPIATAVPLFAATALAGTPLPLGFREATARTADSGWIPESGTPTPGGHVPGGAVYALIQTAVYLGPDYVRRHGGFAQTSDFAGAAAFDLGGPTIDFGLVGPGNAAAQETIKKAIREIAGSMPGPEGRLEYCIAHAAAPYVVDFRFYDMNRPANDTAKFRFVRGVDGARCAVQGSITGNGTACQELDLAALTIVPDAAPVPGFITVDPASGTRLAFQAKLSIATLASGGEWVFVVREKAGLAHPARPGQFDPVGVIRIAPSETGTAAYCLEDVIFDDIRATVDAILSPAPDAPWRGDLTCAGPGFADRVALENDLSPTDGDPNESSWRQALQLARIAADEADRLGEQVIEQGLLLDGRIEDAEAELEAICGAPVNLGGFFPPGPPPTPAMACHDSVPASNTCPAGYECRNEQCLPNVVELLRSRASGDPSAELLASCIGDGSIIPYVSLGDTTVCLWKNKDTNEVCSRDLTDGGGGSLVSLLGCPFVPDPCPVPVPPSTSCPDQDRCNATLARALGTPTPPPTHDVIVVDSDEDDDSRNLKIFKAQTGGEEVPPCQEFRRIRLNRGGWALLLDQEKIERGFFSGSNMARIAEATGWEARPLNFSAVTYNGSQVFSTGDRFSGSTQWPCGGARVPDECVGSNAANSLFCAWAENCAPEATGAQLTQRAQINHRLGRAVFALKALTGASLVGSVAPYLPNAGAIAWDTDPDDAYYYYGSAGGGEDWPEGGFASDEDHPALFPDVSPVALGGGREFLHASAASFWIYDVDDYDDDHVRYEIPGDYFCSDVPSGAPLWTAIREGVSINEINPNCRSNADGERLFVFKRFTETPVSQYDAAIEGTTTQRVWAGMVRGQAAVDDPANIASQLDVLVSSPLTRYSGGRLLFDDDVGVPVGTNAIIHQRVVGGFRVGERPPGRPTESGPEWANSAHIAYDGFTWGNVGDAMELACELRREAGRAQCSVDPPDAESLRDLGRLQKYLECWANGMQDAGAKTVLVNLPEAALASLETSASLRGRHGEDLAQVASGIVGLRTYPMTIQSVIRAVALDIEELRTQLHINQLQRDRVDLAKWSNIANQLATCGAAVANSVSVTAAATGYSAAITCANSVAQVGFALATADIDRDVLAGAEGLDWINFRRRFADHADNLQTAARELQKTTLAMQGGLASLEADRQTALRHVAQALLLDSDSSGRYLHLNTSMRRHYNTSLTRYERSFDNAVHHAWQARRAVEQRLGMSLSEMRDPLGPMEPPSRWADGLCTMTGIDYSRIRSAAGPDLTDDYAAQFIGDYVTNLENVVNYYRSTYPHTREATTAVVSVRDDILGVRDECEIRVSNLLEESSYLDRERSTNRTTPLTVPDGGAGGSLSGSVGLPVWERRGCAALDGGVRGCVDISELPRSTADGGTDLPPIPVLAAVGVPSPGYRLTFGAGAGEVSFSATATHVGQRVFGLPAGYYKVSWSGRASTASSGTALNPATVVSVRDASGSTTTITTSAVATEARTGWWDRYHFMFQLSGAADVDLVILPSASAPAGAQSVDLAAFMLESASDDVPGAPSVSDLVTPVDGGVESVFAGGDYIATGQPGIGQGPACEDTDGSEMRKRFTRTCTRLCAAGWGSCEGGEYHCFYETNFDITVNGLENGSQLRLAQFAYGNFNYRSEEIGVNLVGTGTRDCSESPTPSSCYGIGTAKYSLVHTGPFEVRNHRGDIYQAPLFDGVIESGPAIAAERYITNPLSSADRSLLDPNMMVGMRGRPMTGHYALRIWDDEGFDFSQLADVQLVWNYSYWTRLGVH